MPLGPPCLFCTLKLRQALGLSRGGRLEEKKRRTLLPPMQRKSFAPCQLFVCLYALLLGSLQGCVSCCLCSVCSACLQTKGFFIPSMALLASGHLQQKNLRCCAALSKPSNCCSASDNNATTLKIFGARMLLLGILDTYYHYHTGSLSTSSVPLPTFYPWPIL